MKHKCSICRKEIEGRSIVWRLYDTPWDEKPVVHRVCSKECETALLYPGDFSYFQCDGCDRWICEQNPRNGYMSQCRYDYFQDEKLCLRCYQERILKEGINIDDVKDGHIPGMFFNHGNPELVAAGFKLDPSFDNHHVDSDESCKMIRERAIEWHNQGFIIVFAYESLATIGGEGYVSLYYRRKEKTDKKVFSQHLESSLSS